MINKEESKPAEKLFKLREFENIPARLSTSSTPRSTPKKQSQSTTPKNYIAGNILKARSTPVRELKEQKSQNYQDKLGVIPK